MKKYSQLKCKKTRNIRSDDSASEEFVTKEGLRKRGLLSPILFCIILDDGQKKTKDKIRNMKVGY